MAAYRCLEECIVNTPSGPDHVKAGQVRVFDADPNKDCKRARWECLDAPAAKPAGKKAD